METQITKLTPKIRRFCEEYILDLNQTQAAIRSGYSKRSAQQQASRMLLNDVVKEYIKFLIEKRSEATKITSERVLEELANIAFGSMKDFVEEGKVKDLKNISAAQLGIISELETSKDGKTKIKLYAKDNALVNLMRHLGLFEKDNAQQGIKIKVTRK